MPLKHLIPLLVFLTVAPGYAQPAAPWLPFEQAVEAAAEHDKKVLVFVEAPWCGWCRKLERAVFEDDTTMQALTPDFAFTRLDLDDAATTHRFKDRRLSEQALARHLGAETTPTTLFLDATGTVLARLPTYVEPADYVTILRYVGSDAYRMQTFETYSEH